MVLCAFSATLPSLSRPDRDFFFGCSVHRLGEIASREIPENSRCGKPWSVKNFRFGFICVIFAGKLVTLLPDYFRRMRKPGFILLLFICCLCLTAGGERTPERILPHPAGESLDRATDVQWLVERYGNSDLNLPQPMREVTPGQTARPAHHGGNFHADRHAQRLAACSTHGIRGSGKETRFVHPFIPVSGARAADYYVYRLRRLII